MALVVLAVVGAGAGLFAGTLHPGKGNATGRTAATSTGASSAAGSEADPSTAATDPATPSESESSTPPVTSSTTSDDPGTAAPPTTRSEARRWLAARAEADQTQVESVLDRWIPILSSKRTGMVDKADPQFPGRRYDAVMVVSNFEYWRQRFPDALLARSSDYISHHPGYWITLVPQPRRTPDAVISWCQQQGLSPNDCYATRVSHTRRQGDDTARTWG